MKQAAPDTFSLEIFEGPLAFLLHLIQKSEIDICDVPIQELTAQYLHKIKEILTPSVDTGAEFIGAAAYLLWMKSKMLLPKHEVSESDGEELDPSFEIIYKLLEYCQFKEAGKNLSRLEHEQSAFHARGIHSLPEPRKMLGIEHLSFEDLGLHFQRILARAPLQKRKIHEEAWRVSDKIGFLRDTLKLEAKIPIDRLFTGERPKIECIVTFLAILELMKIGEIIVGREAECDVIFIFSEEAA